MVDLIKDNIIKKAPNAVTKKYNTFILDSVTGVIYVTNDSLQFVSGHIRMLGRKNGQYPFRYKKMLEEIFGMCSSNGEQVEVCSGWVRNKPGLVTVDINPTRHPTHVGDGQSLPKEWDNRFDRWYSDPPYNGKTAERMYGTKLPEWNKLLVEGARVTKPGGLMFLLLGGERMDNMQWHPKGTIKIGWFALSIIPIQESRALHMYLKNDDALTGSSIQKETPYHIQTLTSFL